MGDRKKSLFVAQFCHSFGVMGTDDTLYRGSASLHRLPMFFQPLGLSLQNTSNHTVRKSLQYILLFVKMFVVLQHKQIKSIGYDGIRNAKKTEVVKDMTVEEAYKQVCDKLKAIYDVKDAI